MKPSATGTQAVSRAIALLKAFTVERPERTLPDLQAHLGLSRPTVYRMLAALEGEGLVERAPGEGYRLGPEVLALAAGVRGAVDLRSAARGELLALADATRETATLEIQAGRDVLILDESIGPHVVGSRPSLGTRWPMHATSTGRALLAHLPEGEADRWLEGPLPALTPRTPTDPKALRRELARVREKGYAVSVEELELGFVAVGAVVRGPAGDALAAVSVGGPRGRLGADRMVALGTEVMAAAARVSRRLGWAPGAERPGRSQERRS